MLLTTKWVCMRIGRDSDWLRGKLDSVLRMEYRTKLLNPKWAEAAVRAAKRRSSGTTAPGGVRCPSGEFTAFGGTGTGGTERVS